MHNRLLASTGPQDLHDSYRLVKGGQSTIDKVMRGLRLMTQGGNYQAIAQQLSLSNTTVRNYVVNIFSMLQVADRVEAITEARDAGLS